MKRFYTEFPDVSMEFVEKHWKLLFFLILLSGFVLRLFFYYVEPVLNRDSMFYIEILNSWAKHGSFNGVLLDFPDLWIPPLFCAMVHYLTLTGLSIEHAGILLSMLSGMVLIPLTYGIAAIFTDRKTICLAAALLSAVHPELVEFSSIFLRDPFYLAFSSGSIFLILRYLKFKSCVPLIGAAVLASLAGNTRFEALEILCIFAFACGFLFIRKEISWKKAMVDASIFCAVFLLFFLLIHPFLGTTYFYHVVWGRVVLYLERFTRFFSLF